MTTGHGTTAEGVVGGPARHVPVLLEEVLSFLAPAAGGIFIDGTFGAGGYSRAILATGASVVAIDRDGEAIDAGAQLKLQAGSRLTLVEGRFSDLDRIARAHGHERVDGVVLDIGVSSMQIDSASRGFSFQQDGPLDMRMSANGGPTVADIVNSMDQKALSQVIAVLGEEKRAKAVAAAIVRARALQPLSGTIELAEIVSRAVGRRQSDKIHPATRTFQALRIFVNQELDELAGALAASERILAEGGRLVVVAFHSLEDRMVKRFLADRSATRSAGSRHAPERVPAPATFELLTRGAIAADADEIRVNPRARSAKLRAARRTAAAARPPDAPAIDLPDLPALDLRSA